jgi:hypothetical protein
VASEQPRPDQGRSGGSLCKDSWQEGSLRVRVRYLNLPRSRFCFDSVGTLIRSSTTSTIGVACRCLCVLPWHGIR